MIGKIERVHLREVWKHEALDFTKWLQENIDVLNDVIDLSLENVEREQSVGNFNVDLIAEDGSGNSVIIENQLGKSDHDHLGKLITYLVGLSAKAAIWIISDPRPEHISAITWLNESSSANFYLVKLEAIKIGESPPAPLLTLIVGPSEEGKEIGTTKKEIAERYSIRQKFWAELLNYAKLKTKLHAGITPGQYGWIGTGAGKYGLNFNYAIRKNEAQVELYIDRGKDKDEENKQIFDQLIKHKPEIESAFGEPLDWQRLDTKRASRIRKQIMIGGYRDENKWSKIIEQMVDAMIRFENAIKPYIAKLTI